MRKLLISIGILVVVLIVAGVVKREELTRLMAVQTLFDEDRIVENFSNMDALFHKSQMSRGEGPVSPLPKGDPIALPEGVEAWMETRHTTAMVVLSDGEIVYETYRQGTGESDRRISWSVAKSFLSTLMGIVIEEGDIASLDDPVTKYAPDLVGSAYDGATIRDVAHMASGVVFDEDYMDFWSDINRMGRVLALGGSLDDFTADLTETRAEPGADWLYVSMDTHVLGMVIRGATGRRIPDLMEEKILQPLGLEADPHYLTDSEGNAFVLGGLNLTTRDYARFGQMILQGGTWQGSQIVSQEWIDLATTPSAPTDPGDSKYGLQWWVPADNRPGEVFAIGVYGQYIWIDRNRDVVIAVNSADRRFTEDGVWTDNINKLRAITEAAAR
ncbi:serine hydrolase domain-containing protein [Maritimibacter dapengensis]|uniref:Beta-lactamase family protein n=1 Tax=Maritimibacter dapengensis TaxID=2836868 RepID=A0ABS6T016_9RHOB|nr:serine hydrolase [Maritimibacter dapengensis]MBV7378574.1 beta-lactamase family protein [Maritimibacter dapengensis]